MGGRHLVGRRRLDSPTLQLDTINVMRGLPTCSAALRSRSATPAQTHARLPRTMTFNTVGPAPTNSGANGFGDENRALAQPAPASPSPLTRTGPTRPAAAPSNWPVPDRPDRRHASTPRLNRPSKSALLILALEGQGAASPRWLRSVSSLARARCGPVLARQNRSTRWRHQTWRQLLSNLRLASHRK